MKDLHPRNRHRGRYDFAELTQSLPELSQFLIQTPYGDTSIDFANPDAVKTLNRAILKQFYNISNWDIPAGYLCPPIPGRADYLHYIADLLTHSNRGKLPIGPEVRVLDIGVGANCVYPIIGHFEYGWSFIGSEIDPKALDSARRIIESNPQLKNVVEIRLQRSPSQIFEGVLEKDEKIDLTICNPPFYSSSQEALENSRRKSRNLGTAPVRNFGGQGTELWTPGGETGFIRQMIQESAKISKQCRWFSTLVSRVDNLEGIYKELKRAKVMDYREQRMSQGQKVSRIVAWTFLT
jgi:23S rRNA (adenine1618-N6)-methyltransferase